jgi:hypothetical protein
MAAKLTRLTHNSYTTAPSGRQLYHLQFSLQAASLETFGLHPRTYLNIIDLRNLHFIENE